MLFNNSLRAWQARYKANQAATSLEQPAQEGGPSPQEGQTHETFAGARGGDREAPSNR
jgi:hypothetical protein